MSTLFDIGGVAGDILAGYVSDRFQQLVNGGFVYASIALYCYREYGGLSMTANVLLMTSLARW